MARFRRCHTGRYRTHSRGTNRRFLGTHRSLHGTAYNSYQRVRQPFPGNQIPASLQSPIAQLAAKLYPLPNIGANVFESTQLGSTNYDHGGFRLDHYFGAGDQLFARFSKSSLNEFDPLPIAGAGVPGFPVTDAIVTNSATSSWVHLISPKTVQTVRVSFLRNVFDMGQAVNHTPRYGNAKQPCLSRPLQGLPPWRLTIRSVLTGPLDTFRPGNGNLGVRN
jgi:hypothetical protein